MRRASVSLQITTTNAPVLAEMNKADTEVALHHTKGSSGYGNNWLMGEYDFDS